MFTKSKAHSIECFKKLALTMEGHDQVHLVKKTTIYKNYQIMGLTPHTCFNNVNLVINQFGGKLVLGWDCLFLRADNTTPHAQLGTKIGDGLYDAMYHAIWQTPEGDLIDPTPMASEFELPHTIFIHTTKPITAPSSNYVIRANSEDDYTVMYHGEANHDLHGLPACDILSTFQKELEPMLFDATDLPPSNYDPKVALPKPVKTLSKTQAIRKARKAKRKAIKRK